MNCFIRRISFATGSETESVRDAAARGVLLSAPEALERGGFRQHHFCESEQTVLDLATAAVAPLADDLSRIGAIVHASTLPQNAAMPRASELERTRDVKVLMDFVASRLQAQLRLDDAFVIGIVQQACTGLLGAIRVARLLLMEDESLDEVLCVTADRFPEGALYEQAFNLISDGAVACIVSRRQGPVRLLGCHARTNGGLAQASDEQTVGSFFPYTVRVIQELLERNGRSIDDVRWLVAQNTHVAADRVLASLLRLDPERIAHPSLPDVGHMISGDNLVNLQRMLQDGRVDAGDTILLPMTGYGLNWQCLLLEACG